MRERVHQAHTHKANTNTTIFSCFFCFSCFWFSNWFSTDNLNSAVALFDYASMYLISEGCRCCSHRINVGSFQRLLEIQIYVMSIRSSLPISLHLSLARALNLVLAHSLCICFHLNAFQLIWNMTVTIVLAVDFLSLLFLEPMFS